MPLYYAYILLFVFYLLLVLEFNLPSGGLIGIAAFIAIVASIAIAFNHSTTAGLTILTVTALTTPPLFAAIIHLWPHTPLGQRVLNRRPGQIDEIGTKRTLPDGAPLETLIGKSGIAKTNLLPSGLVKIDSWRLDAISIGMPIDAGSEVIVIKIQAGRIQVRPLTDSERRAKRDDPPRSPESLENAPELFDFESLD